AHQQARGPRHKQMPKMWLLTEAEQSGRTLQSRASEPAQSTCRRDQPSTQRCW
ncbi:hypothetical protein AAVH_17521, partial [Aphelenchoides avenae]